MADYFDHYFKGRPARLRRALQAFEDIRAAAGPGYDDPVVCVVGPVPVPQPGTTDSETGDFTPSGPAPDLAYALVRCTRPLPVYQVMDDATLAEAVATVGVMAGGAVVGAAPPAALAPYVRRVRRGLARPTQAGWLAGMNPAQRAVVAALQADMAAGRV